MLLFSVIVATGQGTTGSLSGIVVDPFGSVLPGVEVSVSGPVKSAARSDESGTFSLPGLKPGVYSLRLELSGFRFTTRDIALNAGENKSLHLAMQLRRIACDGEWMPAELDHWRSEDGSTL